MITKTEYIEIIHKITNEKTNFNKDLREALRVRPPYAKASGAYNLRNREQLQGWRHRAGSIQWLRLDAHSGGENRANLLRSRIRPYLCRCHRAEVCGLCRESSSY